MKQAAIFDVGGLVRGYNLPARMKGEIEAAAVGNVKKILSKTRISNKGASIKTQERRMYTVCRSFVELREAKYAIESPHSLRDKHVRCLIDLWVSQGQTGTTIENKLSHLRAFCE